VLQVPLGQRERIKLYGNDYPTPDGTCIRDYIHIDDLASAHLLAIQATTPETAEVFNVGTGNGCSVLEIIAAAEKVTGKRIPVVRAARRPGDPPELVANAALAAQTLSWKPRFPDIEQQVAHAWKWLRSKP